MMSSIGNQMTETKDKIRETGKHNTLYEPVPCPMSLVSAFGVTLVELLVVLAIIGMIIGISVPGLTGYAKQVRLKTAARQVVGLLSLARSVAIGSHEDQTVVIDQARHEIRLLDAGSGETSEHFVRLPSNLAMSVRVGEEESQDAQLVFRSAGSLSGHSRSIVLADNNKSFTISITAATGAISIRQ